jgi:hypothetical protein
MDNDIKLHKLKLPKSRASNLPVFYNHIFYNRLIEPEHPPIVSFFPRLNCYVDHRQPEKFISRIIDYSKI